MTSSVVLNCLLIVIARVVDVSLGTVRTVAVIHGRRHTAWALGFCEVLIWVLVVSVVIKTVQENRWYAIAYALGFATGNYLGITIEQFFAYGRQVVRVFTRRGPEMAAAFRAEGVVVTVFHGEGRDGPVDMLFMESERKSTKELIAKARVLDPTCFYTVGDIRAASRGEQAGVERVGQDK